MFAVAKADELGIICFLSSGTFRGFDLSESLQGDPLRRVAGAEGQCNGELKALSVVLKTCLRIGSRIKALKILENHDRANWPAIISKQ